MKYKLFLLLAIFLNLEMAFSQVTNIEKDKSLTKQMLIEDYELIYSSLINYHPTPFLYTTEKDFRAFYETQKSTFPDSLSELEFHIVARKLIANLKCGHTFGKPSDKWYASLKGNKVLLPFDVKSINNKLYIVNTIDEVFDFDIDDELVSINNVSINDVMNQMAAIQEKDGNTNSLINEMIAKKFRTYYLFLYGFQDEFDIEFKTKSGELLKTKILPTNRALKKLNNLELPENFKKIYENSWSNFCFDTVNNVAYLKINSFGDRKEYKDYYKKIFKHLIQYPDAQLIIDLRDNSGGYFGNGNNFLTYLTPNKFEFNFQKPKRKIEKNKYTKLDKWSKLTKFAFSLKPSKHKIEGQKTYTFTYKPSKYLFKGQVNVITNGLTFSLAALVSAHLKEYGAEFYGKETGGTEMSTNAILNYVLVLPNSKIKVIIAHYHVISNSTKGEFGYGVKPDFYIPQTVNSNNDETLETIYSTIIKKTVPKD